MGPGQRGARGDADPPPSQAAHEMSDADLSPRLAELRDRVDAMGKEVDEFRKKLDDLQRALSEPPAPADEARAILASGDAEAEGDAGDKNGYLERIQGRLHDLIREEMASIGEAGDPSPAVAPAGMVCPSCGMVADRSAEGCPQCGAKTEPAAGGGGRVFPLSAERFLHIFNDRFGWFITSSDKAMHYADRKGDYERAIDILKVVVQFMEDTLALLRNKHRDHKLALAYAYLGRCYFQTRHVGEAIEQYKKGIALKAGNSYNCEIGLTAVYRDLVRTVGETGTPLSRESHPYLSRGEIATLNSLGMRATV